jgi:hypothetical protein
VSFRAANLGAARDIAYSSLTIGPDAVDEGDADIHMSFAIAKRLTRLFEL